MSVERIRARYDENDPLEVFLAAESTYGGPVWSFLYAGWKAGRTDHVRRVLALSEHVASSGASRARNVIATEIAWPAVNVGLHARLWELAGRETREILDQQDALLRSQLARREKPR